MDQASQVPGLLPMARRLIDVCKVKPEDKVIVFVDDGTVPAWTAAFHGAAAELGCDALVCRCQAKQEQMADFPPHAVETLTHADIVLDLTTTFWAYSDSHARLDGGSGRPVRHAHIGGSPRAIETIRHFPPDPELQPRINRAAEVLDRAQTFHVTSGLGTDLTLQRGDRSSLPVLKQGVPVTQPGQYGDPFGGWVAMALPEEGINGIVQYVGAYDAAGGPQQRVVDEPIEIRIERGRIVHIGRDHGEAKVLAEWFESWHDSNSYRFSHFNVSLDQRARNYRFPDTPLHAPYGGILIAFGSNYSPGIFGPGSIVRARSHIDMTLMGASLEIDGQAILIDGEFTAESGLRSKLGSVKW